MPQLKSPSPPRAEPPPRASAAPNRSAGKRPRRAPLTRRRKLIFLLTVYLLFFAGLGAVELAVRLFLPHIPAIQVFIDSVEPTHSDSKFTGAFEADSLLVWRMRSNVKNARLDQTTFSTNDQGLRYPASVGPKRPGVFRILCFGDSVTFGYHTPLTFEKDPMEFDPSHQPYALVMERRLRELNPGREIEVIPMACPGYTTHQGRAWMERDLATLQPDVVTMLYGFNDTTPRAQPDAQAFPSDAWRVLRRAVLMRSQTLIHLARWRDGVNKRRSAAAPPPPANLPGPAQARVPEAEFVENLMAMTRMARDRGARAILISPVYQNRFDEPNQAGRFASYSRALAAAAAKADAPLLRIETLTPDGYPSNPDMFSEVIHPVYFGHWLIAAELLHFMDERKLLGDIKAEP